VKKYSVESRDNKQFRMFHSLTTSKGLKQEGLFILSGPQLVQEFLKKPTLKINAELISSKMQSLRGADKLLSPELDFPVFSFNTELFNELDVLGTHSPLLVLEQPSLATWNFDQKISGLHLLCPLGDPGNLGAVLRSAEAFGVEKVILLQESAHPFLPKSVKASSGSVCRLPLFKGPSSKQLPRFQHAELVGLDMKGKKLSEFQWPKSCYLLVGEEGAGLPNHADLQKISIPTKGVESLNASIATSLALYDHALKKSL